MAATIPVDAVPGGATASGTRVGLRSFLDRFGGVVVLLALLPLALLWLLPFYLMIRNALMTQAEISSFEWAWWPAAPQWSNFGLLFDDPSAPMDTGLRNSALIALANLIFQTLFASMAGYALARLPVRGRNAVLYLILATVMVPAAVTFVPTFVVVAWMGGVNTLWGLIVPTLFSAFSTFLFRQYYLDFPQEIEEAGRLDGLSYLGVYRELMLPNSKGILAALGVLSFIYSWNAFLWPLVIGQKPSSWTTQIVLSTFLTAQTINVPMLFAGAVVGALPLVIAFLVLQRFIVEGVRLSGVKG
jgi:multiple sugar transport system permease protein